MAKGDTKTNNLLDIAAHGTRADLPAENCCNTRTQSLIVDVAERIMDVEDEVEEIKNNPDVADIVATYSDLQSYDTSHLTDKDVIRVLADETHDGQSTYYRWDAADQEFDYIGTVGDYYTKTQVDGLLDGKQDVLTAGENITIEDESGSLVISSTGGSNYTAGNGIDITNAVISATNTGKARVLTTDDYNYNSSTGTTTAPNCVALWKLDPGLYTVGTSSVMTVRTSGEIATYMPGVCLVTETHSNGNKSLFYFADNGALRMTVFVVNATNGALQYEATNALQSYVDNRIKTNAGTPTTSTVGTVGQLLEDTTNGKLYQCTDTTGGSYTWVEVGAGGGGSSAVELTSADYNWHAPSGGPDNDGVALWLLESDHYTFANGVKVYTAPYSSSNLGGQAVTKKATVSSGTGDGYILYMPTSDHIWAYRGITTAGNSVAADNIKPVNVLQATGTSITSVMSQNAVTSMVYADPSTRRNVKIGLSADVGASSSGEVAIGEAAYAYHLGEAALGSYSGPVSPGLGEKGVVWINARNSSYGYNSSNYRLLTGLYDGQSVHDAATYGQVISYSAINGAGAPTTATEGKYVGQLYYDTTNEAMYFLKTIDTTTTPATYTWEALGGGSSVNVVQTKGTSTTDVMSQDATSKLIFPDPTSNAKIRIGNNSSPGDYSVIIGFNSAASQSSDTIVGANSQASSTYATILGRGCNIQGNSTGAIAIGEQAEVTLNHAGAIALGSFSKSTRAGEMNIGTSDTSLGFNTSNYRLISGVYDPQSAHDAATKGYVDGKILSGAGAPTTSTTGTVGQVYQDTTNGKLYICTAIVPGTDPDPDTYTWTEVGAGGGGMTELTSADFDYPTNNPSSVALWLLDEGVYYVKTSIGVRPNNVDMLSRGIYVVAPYGTASTQIVAFDIESNFYRVYRTTKSSGNSATAMSIATLSDLYADPSTMHKIKIGAGTSTSEGNNAVEIGRNAAATGTSSVALGNTSSASKLNTIAIGQNSLARGQESIAIGDGSDTGNDITNSVALGSGAQCHYNGEVNIGSENSYQAGYNSSNYRLLTGLYDPQSAHDAATKGYVDPTTDSSAPTTATVGRLGQIFIDTTNAAAYMCVAVDTVTPSYTWRQITS